MSRSSSNSITIEVELCEFVVLICWIAGMIENGSISGVATALAIVSGEAPGSWAVTETVGEVDLRQGRHRQLPVGEQPRQRDRDREQDGRDGPPDEQRRRAHELTPPAVSATVARRALGDTHAVLEALLALDPRPGR